MRQRQIVEEKWFTSRGLENLVGVIGIKGDYQRAVRLYGAAEALREAIEASLRRGETV